MSTNQTLSERLGSRWILRMMALLYIGLLVFLPLLTIFQHSFEGGIDLFWQSITSPQALYALRLTFIMAFCMVIINIITGTMMAYTLVRYQFPFKNVINALIDLPFAIPTVVTGIMLVSIYGPNSLVGGFLKNYSIEVIFAKPGIVLALLFVTFPFVVRAVQPVLEEMDLDMEEAAKTLGAKPFTIFCRVTLPSLSTAILSGAALSFSRAMGEFGSIVIVSGNIPFKTQVASVYIYGELESYNPYGALGVSVVLLTISFLILIIINLMQKKRDTDVPHY